MFKKYRVYSKFRFTIFLSIMVLIIGMAVSSLMGYNDASGDSIQKYTSVIVNDGDTLWSIAERYADGSNKDIREFIYEISSINQIENSQLYIGQKLSVPVL